MKDLPSESSTAKPSASPEALVDRLFQVLHTMYGRGWADLWIGVPLDAVKAEWARSLQGVQPEAIRLALEALKTEGRAYAPNLPEFVSLCRQFVRRGPHTLAIVDKRRTEGPDGGFQSLRDILAKAGHKA